jgi:deoxyribonuclease V
LTFSANDLFEFTGLEQAVTKQQRLSALVKTEDPPGFNPTLICGLDAAYTEDTAIAVAAVWDPATRRIVEIAEFRDKISVDYKPGFFGFREGRPLVGAVARLDSNPDVLIVDGHGMAHPRQFGLACHVGLAVNKPTIGVAKSHFYGTIEGERIFDNNGRILGKVLTKKSGRSCYVSVGHKISLDKAVQIVESCMVDKFPVPLRIAHSEVVRLRENFSN